MTIHLITHRRMAQMRELASLGITRRRSASLLGISYVYATLLDRKAGVKRPYDSSRYADAAGSNVKRSATMAALYRDGFTLEQIGAQFGITRERVRQLLKKHQRLTGGDGGQAVRSQRVRERRNAARDAKYLQSHGCTYAQYCEVRDIGRKMREEGYGVYQTPLRAYINQRNNAKPRGIAWEFTFWQWWTIWQESGHWNDRGRGQGYVMCRKGDVGPYAVGNVYIDTAAHNSSEGQRHVRIDPSLPIGVRKTESGKYFAQRRLNGRVIYLGAHDTPELAYAAYLMAGEPGFVPPALRDGRAAPGTKGYQKRGRRYMAYVYRGSKQVYLGSFGTAEEARAAHLDAKAARAAA